ncbi:MAG TPA: iron ABC transporter permease [Planctomycetota bacterium]|nr:iron ABC transporter permease [Planctomycetota bacterium]
MVNKRASIFFLVLIAAVALLLVLAAAWGETALNSPLDALRALFSSEAGTTKTIFQLRLYRGLCAAGVGGSLALGGATAQGLFRNPLADPSLLGVSGGAGLGAMLGIAILGGHGAALFSAFGASGTPGDWLSVFGLMAIPSMALIGALAASFVIYRWAVRQGQLSISIILLAGLALNSLAGAAMAGLQTLLLDDVHVTRAIVSWGFGALNDRGAGHALIVWIGAAGALASIPLIGLELDMLASGDADAEALGANTARIKTLALAAIALSTATAVSVCGQIAFVGLLVPHLVRRIARPRHRSLMLLSFLTGASLLLLVVVIQNGVLPELSRRLVVEHEGAARVVRQLALMQPGVTTSLIGAPFFLVLLMRERRRW